MVARYYTPEYYEGIIWWPGNDTNIYKALNINISNQLKTNKMRNLFSVLASLLSLLSGQLFSQEWTTTDQYGTYNKDGFVFCNDRWSGKDFNLMAVQTGPALFSYWSVHNVTNSCCNSPYACIGTLSGEPNWGKSDQYGLPGSHLPIKLSDIEVLKGKWTFQIPMPTSMDNQYRVYYEIFLSSTTAGKQDAGNICIVFWDNQFEHYNGQPFGTTCDVSGYTMDVLWEDDPYEQGDMTDCVFPLNTYAPDANGIITVPEMDIKAVLDWCMEKYPGSYSPDSYLAHLSLAYEVMTLHGTIKTTFASFNLKKKGSPAYYTPEWTEATWGPAVPVTGITVDPPSATINGSATQQLTATVLPSNASNPSITWSSSNTNVATISPYTDGLVNGVGVGKTTITATTKDGGFTATSDITVNNVAVTGVSISPATSSMYPGQKVQLNATVTPSNALNKNITWSSNKPSIATVDANGEVTGVAAGTAIITATTSDGSKKATADITINSGSAPDIRIYKETGGSGGDDGIGTMWNGNAVELTSSAFEGSKHYQYDYNIQNNWAGLGFYFDPLDITGYSYFNIALKNVNATSSPDNYVEVVLQNDDIDSDPYILATNTSYQLFSIPVENFTNVDLSNIEAVMVSLRTTNTSGNGKGTVYIDDVYFSNSSVTNVPVNNITVIGAGNANTITTNKGILQLSASVLPNDASNKNLTWSVTNGTGMASISTSGLVTAIANGTVIAKAIAKDGSNVSGTLTITISNQVIPVSGINVTATGGATSITSNKGTLQLSAEVLPANATNKSITWSVTNVTGMAIISTSGLLTAIANGNIIAVASANDGSGITGTLIITISNQSIPVTDISVTSSSGITTITSIGGTLQLATAVLPVNATNKNVTWSVTNGTGEATISSSGLLTSVAYGTVTAKATTNDGSAVFGTLSITISDQNKPVSSITVTGTGGSSSINSPGGTLQLSASVLPADATNKNVSWSISSGSDKASINDAGLVTAITNGTTTATAAATDGSGIKNTFNITISGQLTVVTSISVTPKSISIPIGASHQLSVTILPESASNKDVVWSTSNASTATVSPEGLISAIIPGKITITAISKDGGKIDSSIVTTVDTTVHITGITLEPETVTLAVGSSQQLLISVLPNNASNKSINWNTSNPDIAIVSANGLITALTPGNAFITATTIDGSKTAEANIIVNIATSSFENIKDQYISLYPNPVHSPDFKININGLSEGNLDIIMINMQGSIVYSNRLVVSDNNIDLQFKNLTQGVYIIRMFNNNQFIDQKLIVK